MKTLLAFWTTTFMVLLSLLVFATDSEASRLKSERCVDQQIIISEFYVGILNREPDPNGLDFWVSQIDSQGYERIANHMLRSPEAQRNYPTVESVYMRILDRPVGDTGFEYWSTKPILEVVLGVTFSEENLGCKIQTFSFPAGYADAGNGVFLPEVLLRIAGCESGSGPNSVGDYAARNPRSTASGRWQMIGSTARAAARSANRPDLIAYGDNVAASWSPRDQDLMALEWYNILNGDVGSSAGWKASQHCWG